MKIAFIGARGVVSKYSGIETYYEEVGSRLVKRGHEVTVYCRTYFTPRVKIYKGMSVRRLPTVCTKHLETIVHSALCTLDAICRRYDIVQFHALGSSPLSVFPRFLGTKTVVSVRGLDGNRAKWNGLAKRYLQACEWASIYCPSATAVVSRHLADYYAQSYGADTVYIPNGVTMKESIPPNQIAAFGLGEKNYILYVGRLTPEKGCHDLIEAYKGIDTHLKLVFVGDSTYADDYVTTLKKNASDRILFLGFQTGEALEELFSNAYLYVLPSSIEGLSISLLEAMSYGNCVLTSNIPENLGLISGRGFDFHSGDICQLRRMISSLIQNPSIVKESGNVSRSYIGENYTWDIVTEKTEHLFMELIGEKNYKEVDDSRYKRLPPIIQEIPHLEKENFSG